VRATFLRAVAAGAITPVMGTLASAAHTLECTPFLAYILTVCCGHLSAAASTAVDAAAAAAAAAAAVAVAAVVAAAVTVAAVVAAVAAAAAAAAAAAGVAGQDKRVLAPSVHDALSGAVCGLPLLLTKLLLLLPLRLEKCTKPSSV
jgi:hypothetical protein